MHTEIEILKLVCERLNLAEIPYMLTGSFAANFYAIPRMTRDLDFVIELTSADAKKIFEIFKSDFYIDSASILDAIDRHGMFNIIHNDSIFKIDFIIRKNHPYRKVEFERRKKIEFDFVPIWIVSIEDLILSKLYWAKDSFSEYQLKDVKNLLYTKEVDMNYIKGWVSSLELEAVYKKVCDHG